MSWAGAEIIKIQIREKMKKYLSIGITPLLAVACATPDYSISEQASACLRGRVAFPPVSRDFFEYHFHKELSKIPSSSYPAIYSLGWASAFDDPNNCGWDFHVIGEAPKVIEVTFSGNGFSKTYKAETETGVNGYFENEVLQRNLLLYMISNVSIADRKAWEESEVSVRIKGSSDIFKFYIPKSESPVLLWNRGYEYPFLADRKPRDVSR